MKQYDLNLDEHRFLTTLIGRTVTADLIKFMQEKVEGKQNQNWMNKQQACLDWDNFVYNLYLKINRNYEISAEIELRTQWKNAVSNNATTLSFNEWKIENVHE